MLQYITKRFIYGLFVLLGVVILVFVLFNILPGDPARLTMGQRADVASVEAITKELGLDQPKSIQLVMYLNDISPLSIHSKDEASRYFLDPSKYEATPLLNVGSKTVVVKKPYLRRSYQTKRKVTEIIAEALPNTVVLALTSIILASIFGIFFGIIAALKQNTIWDTSAIVTTVLGISAPSYFTAMIFSWLFGYVLSDLTGLNMTGSLTTIDPFQGGKEVLSLKNLILPMLALGIRPMAIITQLTRSSMLEVMSQDFIRTATAKGLSRKVVIAKHALRNALNPVVTAISGWFAALLAGAFFVETIFKWNGLGYVGVDALLKSDFPVIMGIVLFTAVVFVTMNILVDVVYGILDPRISLQGSK